MSKMMWFRFYNEVYRDPKVQRLPNALFKAWVCLLCLASANNPRGTLPEVEILAYELRKRPVIVRDWLTELTKAGLLNRDERSGRVEFSIHGWTERQFESDSSVERTQRYRGGLERHKNVTVTPSETETDQMQTRKADNPIPPNPFGLVRLAE
jgi:hypothetical protein